MYTSPTRRPSGCGSEYAMTSVRPRRPVARWLRRRMAAAESSVISSREPAGARSHTRTRRAARISTSTRRSRGFCRGLPGRTDAAGGLRIVDPVVIHPAQDDQEGGFDLLDLPQGQRCLIQLAGIHLRADDMTD